MRPSAAQSARALARAESDSLVLSGSNGTLKLTDIRLIVSEVELEGEADSAEFEAGSSFLDLPLDTTEIAPVAADSVPPGRYTEFEFNVEDVDLGDAEEDEDDDGDGDDQLRALRDTIRQDFPNWPEGASMVAVGTFVPEEGEARSFTTYFEAELEVERELSPALEVSGDGFSRTLTVKLDPSQWFEGAGDRILDLSQFDGELVELEFEDGVVEVESDEGDDGNEDDD